MRCRLTVVSELYLQVECGRWIANMPMHWHPSKRLNLRSTRVQMER